MRRVRSQLQAGNRLRSQQPCWEQTLFPPPALGTNCVPSLVPARLTENTIADSWTVIDDDGISSLKSGCTRGCKVFCSRLFLCCFLVFLIKNKTFLIFPVPGFFLAVIGARKKRSGFFSSAGHALPLPSFPWGGGPRVPSGVMRAWGPKSPTPPPPLLWITFGAIRAKGTMGLTGFGSAWEEFFQPSLVQNCWKSRINFDSRGELVLLTLLVYGIDV